MILEIKLNMKLRNRGVTSFPEQMLNFVLPGACCILLHPCQISLRGGGGGEGEGGDRRNGA